MYTIFVHKQIDMSTLYKFAKTELDILIKKNPDHIIKDFKDEILNLVKKFSKSGLSGSSAPFYALSIKECIGNILSFMPLTPLTFLPNEFETTNDADFQQNKRLSSVFKDIKNGKFYYLYAITFEEQSKNPDDNFCYFGNGTLKKMIVDNRKKIKHISSAMYIKTFPFEPKTFKIKVDSYHRVIDNEELKEVLNYYDGFLDT